MSRATPAVTPRPRSGSVFAERFRQVATALWLPALLILVWWAATRWTTTVFFPPPTEILVETWNQWVVFGAWTNVVSSLQNLFIGYLLGALIGIVGGTLLWRFLPLRAAMNPIVYFLYVLPAPALLPAMIAIFGVGEMRQIGLIALGAIWPTLLNSLDGMRGIDEVKFDTAKALRLGGWRTYFRLVLPGSAPSIAAGLRASLAVSIVLMVVSEMVAAQSGIGYFILQAQAEFRILNMWTGILVLALIGTILNYLFVFIERLALRWHYRSRAQSAS